MTNTLRRPFAGPTLVGGRLAGPRLRLMVATVLLVEDDPTVSGVVEAYLRKAGYDAVVTSDGETALQQWVQRRPDVVVLDIMLPGMSGLDVLRRRRADDDNAAVIILSARGEEDDRLVGLDLGADDYLVKPFHKEELLARSRALLRRSAGWSQALLESGPLILDTGAKQARVDGTDVELTAYEYRVLEYLLLHAGEVVSKTALTEHLYSEEDERDSNVIEVFIRRLRSKLDPDGKLNPIVTLRGSGYRWDLPRK